MKNTKKDDEYNIMQERRSKLSVAMTGIREKSAQKKAKALDKLEVQSLERQVKAQEILNLGPGKYMGECMSCGVETVLAEETDMCGPCTFGEADTINGNW